MVSKRWRRYQVSPTHNWLGALNGLYVRIHCKMQSMNYQFHQPLAQYWGGGTMSSSDGQRFPVAVKARNSKSIPKYGYGRILTYYTWSSDQHSQWRCMPQPSAVRDATYVLDGMMDNETELPLYEHTIDTAGYRTHLCFFRSPRIYVLTQDKRTKKSEYQSF